MLILLLTFYDSSFNSFSTSTCFVLFEEHFYLSSLNYHQNMSFYEISNTLLLAKFVFANLAVKYSSVKLLNHAVVIYLLWSGISCSTAVRAVAVAKFVILGTFFLISFI